MSSSQRDSLEKEEARLREQTGLRKCGGFSATLYFITMKKDSAKKPVRAAPLLAFEFLRGAVRAIGYYLMHQLLD